MVGRSGLKRQMTETDKMYTNNVPSFCKSVSVKRSRKKKLGNKRLTNMERLLWAIQGYFGSKILNNYKMRNEIARECI